MAVSEPDIKRLWGAAAGRCSSPGCPNDCLQFLDAANPIVVGEMAHVIAKKESGPRGEQGGGNDTYANLILLCPVHHTLIDKAPENYPAEMLLRWKSDHEIAIARSLTAPVFATRQELDAYVERLLIENESCWATYGPDSVEAENNPSSSAGRIWQYRKLSYIVPNNRRIISVIRSHSNLFSGEEYKLATLFIEHAEGFEMNCIEPREGVPRFPISFGELFSG